jgi:tetratricopeptide (TPR) repeat protein
MTPKAGLVGVAVIGAALILVNLVGVELNSFFIALPGADKILHACAYAVLFVCVFRASGYFVRRTWARVAAAAVSGVLLSLGDEFLQQLAPGRNVEFYDLVADWAGLTLGWVVSVRPAPRVAVTAALVALGAAAFVTQDTYARLIDYSRALRAEGKHDFAGARIHYQRALANGHRSASVYNGMAWVTVESGMGAPLEALDYARKAFEMEPDNADILDTYGWVLHRAGQSKEALPFLLRAYALKPSMFCIHYHLGETYLALGQTELADQHFRQQLTLKGTREAVFAARALERPHAERAKGVAR